MAKTLKVAAIPRNYADWRASGAISSVVLPLFVAYLKPLLQVVVHIQGPTQ